MESFIPHYINEISGLLGVCAIQLTVHGNHPNLTKLLQPIILEVPPSLLQFSELRNRIGYPGNEKNVSIKNTAARTKLRHITCLVAVVSFLGVEFQSAQSYDDMSIALASNFESKLPTYTGKDDLIPHFQILPRYFFVFLTRVLDFENLQRIKSFFWSDLPATFIIFPPNPTISKLWLRLNFQCWYCEKIVYIVGCYSPIDCASLTLTMYADAIDNGRKVLWMEDRGRETIGKPLRPHYHCPFRLSKYDCLLDDTKAVLNVVLDALNYTAVEHLTYRMSEERDCSSVTNFSGLHSGAVVTEQPLRVDPVFPNSSNLIQPNAGCVPTTKRQEMPLNTFSFPSIWRRKAFNYEASALDKVVTGYEGEFRIITADTFQVFGSSVSTFTAPLQWPVWLALFAILLSCTVVLVGISNDHPGPRNIMSILFLLSRVLLDQAETEQRVGNRTLAKVYKIIYLVWLVGSVVIVHSYKAIAKSNYFLTPTYMPKWTGIMSMENFTLIFASDTEITDKSGHFKLKHDSWTDYECKCANRAEYNQDGRLACALVDEARDVELQNCHVLFACSNYSPVVSKLAKKTIIIRTRDLSQAISKNLTKPQTAFLSPVSRFRSDWSHFDDYMKANPSGVKFAYNHESRDTTLRRTDGFSSTGGLSPYHKDLVPMRLKGLMSSGIFLLWDRWEILRNFSPLNEKESYVALSFDNSDVSMIFYVLGASLFVAAFGFVGEITFAKKYVAHTYRSESLPT